MFHRALSSLLLALVALPCAAVGIYDAAFGPEQPAGPILCAIEFQGELYVGGDFLVSGRRDTPYVAKFVDGRWIKPLGFPLGAVECLLEIDGVLHIVGNYLNPQQQRRGYVARHDGQNWNLMGGVFGAPLQGGSVIDGEFYVHGRGVHRWNGAAWAPEPGVNTGPIHWIAKLGSRLFAGHGPLGLLERTQTAWQTTTWTFFDQPCGPLGAVNGISVGAIERDGELWMFGEFVGVADRSSGTQLLESPAVVRFDGDQFLPVTTPWPSGCLELTTVRSEIRDAALLGNSLIAVGDFTTQLEQTPPAQMLAVHDGQSWRRLEHLRVDDTNPRISVGATLAYVSGAKITKLESNETESFGRIASLSLSLETFQPLVEGGAMGQVQPSGRPTSVPAMAQHFDQVLIGGLVHRPVGARFETAALSAVRGDHIEPFWVPRSLDPTALLSTASGLYAAEYSLVLSDGVGHGEILIESMNAPVRALLEHDDSIFLGGEFTLLDEQPIVRIARLDSDGALHAAGSADGPVLALAHYQGDLIAAGAFRQIGGIEAKAIARYDGENWHAMGSGFTRSQLDVTLGRVEALWVWQGELLATGDLLNSDTTQLSHIARWDGSVWQPLSPVDLTSPGRCMVEHDGRLIVGGDFFYAGGQFVGHMAAFDDEGWHDLDTDANGNVLALASLDGDLYFGGDFTFAGGLHSFGLGRWRAQPRPEPIIPPSFFSFRRVAPNPFNPYTEIQLRLPRNGPVEVDIFDSRGRLVRALRQPYVLAGDASLSWDGRDESGTEVASGNYHFRARFEGQTLTRAATLLR